MTRAHGCVCSGRRARMRSLPGRLGYSLLGSDEEGMSPAELRALPIVIHERHHHGRASARREDPPADLSVLLSLALPPLCPPLRTPGATCLCCNIVFHHAATRHANLLLPHPSLYWNACPKAGMGRP